MRTITAGSLVLLAMAVLSVAAREEKPEPPKTRQYALHCTLTEFDQADNKKILAEPFLVTQEEKPASFCSGSQIVLPTGKGQKVESAQLGFSARMKVQGLKNGKVRLDVSIQNDKQEKTTGNRTRIQSNSVRSIEFLRPGELVTLELDKDEATGGSYLFEIRVRESEAKASETHGR
jgi:type II secretory pathway component GspD/PulD (secretin)